MILPRFQKGRPLAAADLNLLVEALNRNRILPGVGVKLVETLNGTTVSVKPTHGGGGSASTTERRPWDIINLRGDGEPDEEGKFSTYKAEVWPGTVAGLMPSNVFADGILATFTVGADLQKWKAKCLTDGRQITSVQIVVDPSDPPMQVLAPSALPAQAWFIFGLTFEGKSYRTLGPGNPIAQAGLPLITDKTTPPPPGIPGVDRWYQLIFS